MKKMMNFWVTGIFFFIGLVLPTGAVAEKNYGVSGASAVGEEDLSLEKMLVFSIQDEYLARGEYQKIMEKFGARRPFSRIIKAEERHISLLKPLLEKYNVTPPPDRGVEFAEVPENLAEAFQIGVEAEIANIEMYTRFLKKDLPEDVRKVFQRLLAGSKNHLDAFKRGSRRLEFQMNSNSGKSPRGHCDKGKGQHFHGKKKRGWQKMSQSRQDAGFVQ